jgi:hypothetical protein
MKPTVGPVGTHVVIDGFGFTNDNTIHFGTGVIVHVPVSSSVAISCTTDPNCKGGIHQTLEFDVPAGLNPPCFYSNPRCLVLTRQTTPGEYRVSVTNSNGTSNAKTFTVTGTTITGLHVSSISPRSGPVGTRVTLSGSGFSGNDIVLISGAAVRETSVNSAGTALTFTVPDSVGAYCAPGMMCAMYMRLLTPGPYDISVKDPDSGNESNSVTFTITGGATSGGPLAVTGLDAPTTLALGQQGTWTVHVSVPSTVGQLHYSATWGDEVYGNASIMAPQPQQIQTSASFSHAYQRSGTYTATFTVSDDQGHSVSTSASILVTPLY